MAIITALPSSFPSLEAPVYIALYYVQAVAVIIAGLAPTILVARIVLTNPAAHTTASLNPVSHLTAIQFGVHQHPDSQVAAWNDVASVRPNGGTPFQPAEAEQRVLDSERLPKSGEIVWNKEL
ncbi:hypothetical protein JR316_0006580 [Psilocybe cubensis]|uniref:Uncharacterized protein n=2 Tax=Psilocybe cubensis TaxID=181762 RepID=A0A8H7XJ54_PSICU|nr:hypothetical protein JR316_0006580 [Psilocybe cubensis]KAH9479983.1 hypothetical protein JR316_0006580 [Psilocybe cubensis]